ncbi:MAG TPA: M3 family metallopeptidase [Polyangiales bacterium]
MADSSLASETRDPQRESNHDPELETHGRLAQLEARLAALRATFVQNITSATRDFSLAVSDEASLAGMTERGKARARRDAEAQQREGWLLTLDRRCYEAALNSLDDRKLRHDLYEAYVTRASEQGPRKRRFDNSPLVQEMLALRHELAALHGYENYAEYALRDGLLTTTRDVERYLLTGGELVRARAQAELEEIWTFAKGKGAPKGFATWDLGYYADWLMRERLGFSEDDLTPYFSFRDVLSGLFTLCEKLLGVSMVRLAGDDSGRESALYKVVTDAEQELGWLEIEPVGDAQQAQSPWFKLSDEGPHVGAADASERPVLRVCLALDPVTDDEPVQLAHADVMSLFRCLGQGLFLLLNRPREQGSVGVPHALATAGEVAGRYFERLSLHFETLSVCARHHQTGASLPRELFDQLMCGRAMREGLLAARDLEQGLFDLRVHRDFVPPDKATQLRQHVFDTLSQVRHEVCVLRPPFWDKSVNANRALFVEEGALRAWETVWAKRVAGDLLAAFEAAPFDVQVAARLRDTFWTPRERGLLERLTDALGRPPSLLP